MVSFLKFSKYSFESARTSVKKSSLLSSQKLKQLEHMSFEELLKFLEEHGFREEVDSSYLSYEGFYLIENILNSHLSKEYSQIFAIAKPGLRKFLNSFYLKYQIHNFMVVVRCFESDEKDISPYLIGDTFKQEKFLKAFEMPLKEDALVYLSKKIGLDEQKVLELYNQGTYYLENYLYSYYYEQLLSKRLNFNYISERKFLSSLSQTVDLLNTRTYLRIKSQEDASLFKFEDFFVFGGKKNLSYFKGFDMLNLEETFAKLKQEFSLDKKCSSDKCLLEVDFAISKQKKKLSLLLKTSSFGSPFYILKYFLDLESQMNDLRILLKSKYLGLEKKELDEVLA